MAVVALAILGGNAWPAAVLAITESTNPVNPIGGNCPMIWEITLTNVGDANATGIQMWDTVYAPAVYQGCAPTPCSLETGQWGDLMTTWTLGATIAPGASLTASMFCTSNASFDSQPIVKYFDGTSDQYTGVIGDKAVILTPDPAITAATDVVIDKDFTKGEYYATGEDIKYIISFNFGGLDSDSAFNFRFLDTLPAGPRLISMESPYGGTTTIIGSLAVFSLGDLPRDAKGTATLYMSAPYVCSTSGVTSEISYAMENRCGKTIMAAGTQIAKKIMVVVNGGIDLTKTVSGSTVTQGGLLTYFLSATNPCNDSAINIVLWDTLPAGTVFDSATDSGTLFGESLVGWSFDRLVPNTIPGTDLISVAFSVSVTGAGPVVPSNTAQVRFTNCGGFTQPEKAGSCPAVAVLNPALSLELTGPPSVAGGEEVTFTLTVRNTGTDTAFGVRIVDTLPSLLFAVSPDVDGQVVSWDLGTLNIGASKTVMLVVKSVRKETVQVQLNQAHASCENMNGIAMAQAPDDAVITLDVILRESRVFPSPFNPAKAKGGTLKFTELPDGSKVTILTVSGKVVRVLSGVSPTHRLEWDGKNENGSPAAPGLYLYLVEMPGAQGGTKQVKGRFGLVR